MTRVKSQTAVHYRNPAYPRICLCGLPASSSDLFGNADGALPETTERVTCTACARVVCAIRNDPYNTLIADVEPKVLSDGILNAVMPDGEEAPSC